MNTLKTDQLDYLSLEFGNGFVKAKETDVSSRALCATTQSNLDVSLNKEGIINDLSSSDLKDDSSDSTMKFSYSRKHFKSLSDANYLALKRRYMWFKNNIQSVTFAFLLVALNCGFGLQRVYQYRDTNILTIGARVCGKCVWFWLLKLTCNSFVYFLYKLDCLLINASNNASN